MANNKNKLISPSKLKADRSELLSVASTIFAATASNVNNNIAFITPKRAVELATELIKTVNEQMATIVNK